MDTDEHGSGLGSRVLLCLHVLLGFVSHWVFFLEGAAGAELVGKSSVVFRSWVQFVWKNNFLCFGRRVGAGSTENQFPGATGKLRIEIRFSYDSIFACRGGHFCQIRWRNVDYKRNIVSLAWGMGNAPVLQSDHFEEMLVRRSSAAWSSVVW